MVTAQSICQKKSAQWQVIIVLAALTLQQCACTGITPAQDLIAHPVTVFDRRCRSRNSVVFIRDSAGRKYIVKQATKNARTYDVDALCEYIAARIACESGIPSQCVWIISPTMAFRGKHHANQVATLHTFVPGKEVREHPLFSQQMIRQGYYLGDDARNRGPVRWIIRAMAQHEDLPRIAAFDTFIGNTERHGQNLLYDQSKNRFYAIDMEWAFRCDLCEVAYQRMMIFGSRKLSLKEREGLRLYRDTLACLIEQYPAHVLQNIIQEGTMAVWPDGNIPPEDAAKLASIADVIHTTAHSARKLISVLDKLLGIE